MGLQDLINKYGDSEINKTNWFTLNEANIRIPIELIPYIDMNEGKLEEIKPIPEELQPLVEQFKESWYKIHSSKNLTEY